MRANNWIRAGAGLLLAGLVASTTLAAEGDAGAKGEGRDPMQQFRQKQMKARREHFKAQMEQNQQFRETLKGKQPNEACTEIIANRKAQYAENVAFMDGQHQKTVAFMSKLMQENNVPAETQTERLAKLNERYQEMKTRHGERQKELIAKLTELSSKADLTWEELKKAMDEFRPEGDRGDRDREGRKGRRHGERKRTADGNAPKDV